MLSLQLASAIRNANLIADLKATREELRLRAEELDAYSRTIAHDLKSPLSTILLSTQFFTMRFGEALTPEAAAMVAKIEEQGKMMGRMIDQLLYLAMLRDAEAQSLQVQIRATVDAAISRFSFPLQEKGIRVSIMPDLPDAYGQTQWVEEVFANLIGNAIKYMGGEKPEPTIEIRAEALDCKVRYEVRDTGIGIKPDDIGRLFKMFSRVGNISKVDGLGLGLSIVQRIINKLGGEVGVESTYGEGATFWFTLPANPISQGAIKAG
jgi:signal transduction histidine kinase